ncbi:ECF transporter S component [Phytoactinopolyspora alkaliphila]|uniref:ECF transporter S component n=1 Tax=Phytoactinopolyspora alkaliphila TaxID=1783498 RepID=A0A6N9YTF2_9ACTN|nr:ECF transporter S component [Phytoactinopolyspora alkaliphila]NED98321.1 ECF transporter S component [Phytoactinopolyspora alkaliphila]
MTVGRRPGHPTDSPPALPGQVVSVLRMGPRSVAALGLVSLVGLASFGWPLFIGADAALAHSGDAPWLFAALLPLLLLIVLAQLTEGGMDAKAVALLGVLAALGTGLRVLGGGAGGLEPVFFLFVLAGRVLGPGFGFVLGQLTLLASALVTGGVGPWLPFQMMAAGWIALLAGLLPPMRGRGEILLLAAYGAVAGLLYGVLINLWFWPFVSYADTGISYVAGAPVTENLARYAAFLVATSLGWDVTRAAFTAVFCLVAGRPVLAALRRAARRARFELAHQPHQAPTGTS